MSSTSTQQLESYVPVYDAVPDKWEDARPFLTEMLKKISNELNVREIGYLLDEELLSGKQFIPTASMSGPNSASSQIFRSIFRKVVDVSPITVGVNAPKAHGITFDINFTLIDLWVSGTNSVTFNAVTMSDPSNVTMDATNINITSPAAYDRGYAVVEYTLEI